MYKHIVIEWIHWSWKSSVAKWLSKKLNQLWYNTQYYHFPDEWDQLWQVIRTTVADRDLYKSREVTWLLYAAFSNRFHIKSQETKTIFIQDRDSVTTWLIFQKTIPRETRLNIYKFGIENLRKQWIVFYVELDKDVALQRAKTRNNKLKNKKNGKVRKDKTDDKFLQDFERYSKEYDDNLWIQIQKLWIPFHKVNNNNSLENTINQIIKKINTKLNYHN